MKIALALSISLVSLAGAYGLGYRKGSVPRPNRCLDHAYTEMMLRETGKTGGWSCHDDGERLTYRFANGDVSVFGPISWWAIK